MALATEPPLLYAVAGLLLAAVAYSVFHTPVIRRHGVPLRKAPNTLPLLGNGILFLQARQKLFAWFVHCQRRCGPETLQIAVPTLPPGVLLTDPRNLDFVFRHEGSLVGKGRFVQGMLFDLFGHGIVNADGDDWRRQRKAGASFLTAANLRVLTDEALPPYLQGALDALASAASSPSSTVDLQAVFHELTSRLMGQMAYNMEMHADDAFSVAFDHASAATTERFQNPLWRLTEPVCGAALRRSLAVVKAFGQRIVDNALAERGHQDAKDKDCTAPAAPPHSVSGSLIHSLLDALPDSPDMVADAALNYLSAGRDTVAQALTWTCYRLMQHARVVDKIREEADRIAAATASTSAFTPPAMPYTLAVFYEGLRLYPPIPFEIKQVLAPAGLTLPDGTALPCGALILWCAWALNRSPLTWGPDADDFRPERWLDGHTHSPDSPLRLLPRSQAEFPVFHGGPRVCLGKKMAESVAVQTLAAVVGRFDLLPVDGGAGVPERVSKTSLTLPMDGGLPCRVRARVV